MYYAVIRHEGKLHWRSLETTVRTTPNRKLEDERRKISAVYKRAGKVGIREMYARFNTLCFWVKDNGTVYRRLSYREADIAAQNAQSEWWL